MKASSVPRANDTVKPAAVISPGLGNSGLRGFPPWTPPWRPTEEILLLADFLEAVEKGDVEERSASA